MAKNKRDIDSDVKKKELEKTAARLFITYGYDATSMNRIAQELESPQTPVLVTVARASLWLGCSIAWCRAA